jgi:hypothetical protein
MVLDFGVEHMNNHSLAPRHSSDDLKRIGLKAFFNITESWLFNDKERMTLLGEPGRTTYFKMKRGEVPTISVDQLERISLIMGIYKALRILYPTTELANEWPSKISLFFGNKTAREVMTQGSLLNLYHVRRYLDAMRG